MLWPAGGASSLTWTRGGVVLSYCAFIFACALPQSTVVGAVLLRCALTLQHPSPAVKTVRRLRLRK